MNAINYDQVFSAVRDFEASAKTGRVFCHGDVPFEHKFQTLIQSVDGAVARVSGGGITVLDKTILHEGDAPKEYVITGEDALVVLDNTRLGLFGNITKKDCQAGLLITKKGFFVYNNLEDGTSKYSGFISWETMAAAYVSGDGFVMGVTIYKNHTKRPEIKGPTVAFIFENAASKILKEKLMVLFGHLRLISRGKEDEFEADDSSSNDCD